MVTRLLEHEVRLREAYKARHVVLLDGEEFDEHRRRLSEQRARGQEAWGGQRAKRARDGATEACGGVGPTLSICVRPLYAMRV